MRRFLEHVETKHLALLPYLLGAIGFFVCSAFLAGSLMYIRSARPTTAPIAETATVVVFETARCSDCDSFRSKIGRPHQGSDLGHKVPLRYYDVTDSNPPKRYALQGGLDDGPTAVIFDIYGREQARVSGVPATLADFHTRLLPHMKRAERDYKFALTKGHVR